MNETKKKISFGVTVKMICMVCLLAMGIIIALLLTVAFSIKSSLEEETLRGLLGTAYSIS